MVQNYHTEFLTGTIFNWEHLLTTDDFKNIIVGSFEWLVRNKKCTINAFVIMPNHIHLLWKISDGFERKDVEGALFSFTAHEFKRHLNKIDSVLLEKHFVDKSDRSYLPIVIGMGKNADGERMLNKEFFSTKTELHSF